MIFNSVQDLASKLDQDQLQQSVQGRDYYAHSLVTLYTNDECTHHLILATCYQLAQSILQIVLY